MNTRQSLQIESIRGCLAILRKPDFDTTEIKTLTARLKEAFAEIEQLYVTQVAEDIARAGGTARTKALREKVRLQLRRVSRRALVELEGLPGIEDELRMPPGNAKDLDLVKAVARILKNLRPHLKSLYVAGLPPNAVTQLEDSAKLLKMRATNPDTPIARRSRATASLPAAIRRARRIARSLDTSINADLSDVAITRWATVYRIPRKKGRPRKPRVRPLES